MKVAFYDLRENTSFVLAMEPMAKAYFGKGEMQPGYHLADEQHQPPEHSSFYRDENAEEGLLISMYEGGAMCGLWRQVGHNQDDYRWSWALVPENEEDLRHIEDVIIPYGRYTKKESGHESPAT